MSMKFAILKYNVISSYFCFITQICVYFVYIVLLALYGNLPKLWQRKIVVLLFINIIQNRVREPDGMPSC